MKYKVTLGGKVYEVEVEHGEAEVLSETDVVSVPAVAAAPVPAPTTAPVPAPVPSTGGEQIKSPMPGVILSVSVKEGESVKTGQVILVMEAMKMENEIVAPRDGRVSQILVSKGTTVETGAALAVLA